MMIIDHYQDWTKTTAIYPEVGEGSIAALSYVALGLSGEAGEVANKVKKLLRDGNTEERRNAVIGEIGDVAWYLSQLCNELNISLSDILDSNQKKLNSRKDRGVIQGNGDNR